MTTPVGTFYKKQMEELQPNDAVKDQQERCGNASNVMRGGRDGTSITELMHLMLEDRKQREMELAEERRLWEEERRRKEHEFEEERRRHQVESARREEQALQQMRVLQALVEGVQLQGEAARCELIMTRR